MILGICEGAKSIKPTIKIQTTYLDPVAVYSGFFWQYGIKNFGSCANYSDTYIDTEDRVPGSNQAILHSATFDITQMRTSQKLDIPPHVWPTLFYLYP